MTKDPADERQQVEMAGMGRRTAAGHPEAGDEQRPVERPSVVGHEPAVDGDFGSDCREQGPLVRLVGQEELDHAELRSLPAAEAHEERHGPGGGRETQHAGQQDCAH